MLGVVVINAAAIDEGGFRLVSRARNGRSRTLGRSKHQRTGARENVWVKSCHAPGKIHYRGNRGLVHIRLHIQRTGGGIILLGVAIPAVADIGCEPAIKMIAIADEESTRVSGVLIQHVAVRVFSEKSGALHADFLGAAFVGPSA